MPVMKRIRNDAARLPSKPVRDSEDLNDGSSIPAISPSTPFGSEAAAPFIAGQSAADDE